MQLTLKGTDSIIMQEMYSQKTFSADDDLHINAGGTQNKAKKENWCNIGLHFVSFLERVDCIQGTATKTDASVILENAIMKQTQKN